MPLAVPRWIVSLVKNDSARLQPDATDTRLLLGSGKIRRSLGYQ